MVNDDPTMTNMEIHNKSQSNKNDDKNSSLLWMLLRMSDLGRNRGLAGESPTPPRVTGEC